MGHEPLGDEPSRQQADLIRLVGVRGWGHHGVLASEREEGQEFVVDLDLAVTGIAKAAASDDLADTVNYAEVAQAVVDLVAGPPRKLIESLAEAIAARCLLFDAVSAVEVTVHKPSAPIPVPFTDVALTIRRQR